MVHYCLIITFLLYTTFSQQKMALEAPPRSAAAPARRCAQVAPVRPWHWLWPSLSRGIGSARPGGSSHRSILRKVSWQI